MSSNMSSRTSSCSTQLFHQYPTEDCRDCGAGARGYQEGHKSSTGYRGDRLLTSLPPQGRYVLTALCNSIKKLHAVDVGTSTIYEEYLNVVKTYGAKELTGRRIADYIWELDNTGLTISRISSKRYGKERVVRLGVPINIITRILERLENG